MPCVIIWGIWGGFMVGVFVQGFRVFMGVLGGWEVKRFRKLFKGG